MNIQPHYHDIAFIPKMGKACDEIFQFTDEEKHRHVKELRSLPKARNRNEQKPINMVFYAELAEMYGQKWETVAKMLASAGTAGFGS